MKSIAFSEANEIYAKNQPQYTPLAVHRRLGDKTGQVTSCWGFSWRERFMILFGAPLWWRQLTFNEPLQPVKPTISLKFPDKLPPALTKPPF